MQPQRRSPAPALHRGILAALLMCVWAFPLLGFSQSVVFVPSRHPTAEEGDIRLNELYPAADGDETEFVEIFLQAESARSLEGAYLSRYSTGEVIWTGVETDLLTPEAPYFVAEFESGTLRNDRDTVELFSASGELLGSVEYPNLDAGESWALVDGAFAQTMATRGSANPGASSSSSSGGGGGNALLPSSDLSPSPRVGDVALQFLEVHAAGTGEMPEFVELLCVQCDADLGGLRLGDDSTLFTFPADTYIRSGEIMVIFFGGEVPDWFLAGEGVHAFASNKSGTTQSDETFFAVDGLGVPFAGAACIANGDGSLSAAEQADLAALSRRGALATTGRMSEDWCASSARVDADHSVHFSHRGGFVAPPSPGEVPTELPPRAGREVGIEQVWMLPDGTAILAGWANQEPEGIEVLVNGSARSGVLEDFSDHRGLFSAELPRVPAGAALELRDEYHTTVAIPAAREDWLPEHSPDFVVSEIFSNPAGPDQGNEWVELECQAERCHPKDWAFFVGETRVFAAEESAMARGEKLVLRAPLKNEGPTELRIFSVRAAGSVARVLLPASAEGLSLSAVGNMFLETNPSFLRRNGRPLAPDADAEQPANTILQLRVAGLVADPGAAQSRDGEAIALENMGGAGWLSGARVRVGQRTKEIPPIYLAAGEVLELSGADIPPLPNAGGTVEIQIYESVVTSRSWTAPPKPPRTNASKDFGGLGNFYLPPQPEVQPPLFSPSLLADAALLVGALALAFWTHRRLIRLPGC